MPPHSSHILQPLDVGCFSPLKTAYTKQVEKQIRLGINHITKDDFLSVYYNAHVEAMTTSNVMNGFAACGLVPYDPNRVLDKLPPPARTPSPIPSHELTWDSKTPKILLEAQKQAYYIRK